MGISIKLKSLLEASLTILGYSLLLVTLFYQYKKIRYLNFVIAEARENQIRLSFELSKKGFFEEHSKYLLADDHHRTYLQEFHSLEPLSKKYGEKHRLEILREYEQRYGKIASRNYYNEPSDLIFLLLY